MNRAAVLAGSALAAIACWSCGSSTPIRVPPRPAEMACGDVPVAANEVVVRGRCTAMDGKPLADGEVEIRDADELFGGVLLAHARTDRDGRFVVRGIVEPDTVLVFACSAPGRVRGCEWLVLEPGQAIDLGDVRLHTAIPVRGRCVDAKGIAGAGARVRFVRDQVLEPGTLNAEDPEATVAADGSFDLGPCAAGEYALSVDGERLREPRRVRLLAGEPKRDLVVMVEIGGGQCIRGHVVDEHGAGVVGASVTAISLDNRVNRVDEAVTGADGAFLLRSSTQRGRSCRLQAHGPGHDPSVEAVVRWGEEDVQIVTRPLASLTLDVVDASTSAPVPAFGVRLWRMDSYSVPVELQDCGEHGGSLVLRNLPRGYYRLCVEAPDRPDCPSGIEKVSLTDPAQLRVELTRPTERAIEVRDAAGAAVAGCAVDLVVDDDHPATIGDRIQPLAGLGFDYNRLHYVLRTGTTDDDGCARLRGPMGRSLTLRVSGPHCAPRVVSGVRLDVATPLRVTVDRGVAVNLRLTPPDVLSELAAAGRVPGAATLALTRNRDGVEDRMPLGGSVPVREGEASVDGVLPGTWQVVLEWMQDRDTVSRVLGEVVIGADPIAATLDVSSLRLATVRGRVVVDGRPWPHARCMLRLPTEGDATEIQRDVLTDGEGRFQYRSVAGHLRLQFGWLLAAPVDLVLAPGAEITQDFQVVTASLRLRLVDDEGSPVADVRDLRLVGSGSEQRFERLASDADGICRLPICAPGIYKLLVQTRSQYEKSCEGFVWPREDDYLHVGTIRIAAGPNGEITQMLPPEYFR